MNTLQYLIWAEIWAKCIYNWMAT